MSTTHLGDTLDVHMGGRDLVFPHHENEIAQSEAATGQAFANYWLHTGLLETKGEKMSSSLDNFFTVEAALESRAGVTAASADHAASTAAIEGSAATDDLLAAVEAAGYEASA